jgi:hypothetical protein
VCVLKTIGAISKPIGIKQLLMVVEMARQGDEAISTDRSEDNTHHKDRRTEINTRLNTTDKRHHNID